MIAFENFISQQDQYLLLLDGNIIKDKESFYEAISSGLQFPNYFSNNLDSLDELLADLEWIKQDKVILILLHYDKFLAEDNELKEQLSIIFENNENFSSKEFKVYYSS